MGRYTELKALINQYIKTNGRLNISASILNGILTEMVNSLGTGFQFMGVALPSTNPGTPDQKEYYLAGPGTYPNFGNLVVPENKVALFIYQDTWAMNTSLFDALDKDVLISDVEYAALVAAGEVDPNKIYYVYEQEEA